MIDEKETLRRFGYYARDLAHHSGKRIIAVCDECGKIREVVKDDYHGLCRSCAHKGTRNHNYGKHLNAEYRQKIGNSEKGEKNHNYGKPLSLDTRKKLSVAHTGQKGYWKGKHRSKSTKQKLSEASKKKWQDEKYIARWIAATHAKPNQLEMKLNAILSQLVSGEFVYNGDFSQGVLIGRRIPDFVGITGHKRIIELFGELFHSPLCSLKRRISTRRRYNETMEHYKKCGYKCIILWALDIKRPDAVAFVKAKLKKEGWLK